MISKLLTWLKDRRKPAHIVRFGDSCTATHSDQIERNRAALAGGMNQHPAQQLQDAPIADDIVANFKSAGMTIELGATYSVRGQVAQLIEGVRSLFQIVSSQRADK